MKSQLIEVSQWIAAVLIAGFFGNAIAIILVQIAKAAGYTNLFY